MTWEKKSGHKVKDEENIGGKESCVTSGNKVEEISMIFIVIVMVSYSMRGCVSLCKLNSLPVLPWDLPVESGKLPHSLLYVLYQTGTYSLLLFSFSLFCSYLFFSSFLLSSLVFISLLSSFSSLLFSCHPFSSLLILFLSFFPLLFIFFSFLLFS